jgi:TolB-like protein/DNA-binding winged helix-turn-helix (wHTH) protein/tetratricopeptide (TPR) repeat protein
MTAPPDNRSDQAFEQGFQIGELRIDPPAGEVSGPGGSEKLDPKVTDVLVLLAQHAGQVVLREQLLAQIWPNAIVTDDALSRCIYELRRQLSRAAGDEKYRDMIETVPKRGYRLRGEVSPFQLQPTVRHTMRPIQRILALAVATGAAIFLLVMVGQRRADAPAESGKPHVTDTNNSIAVLPFVDMTEGQDQGYLADGISEEILNRLAQSGKLRVIARTSSFSFRGRQADIAEIAAKLNVSHVLEGSIRRSADKVRITAQLIAASDNSHAWSETYDRKIGDLFAVQDDIAASVATALKVTLAGGTPHGHMPISIEAYEHFLQGHFFYNRRTSGDIERAAKRFEAAVAIDPGYARAWAALAGAYSILAWGDEKLDEDLQVRQGEAARKAVELDPYLAVAHARLAQYYYETRNYKKGDEQERKAAALDPDDPIVLSYTGNDAFYRGDIEEAIALQRRVVAHDPLSLTMHKNLALLLAADGQFDEAISEFRRALELNPDAGLDDKLEIARIFVLQRRYDEAQSAIAQMPEGKIRDHGLALLYRAPGRQAESDAALGRLATQRRDMMDQIRLADVYANRGMIDEAFSSLQEEKIALESAAAIQQPRLWQFQYEIRVSPFLQPLHADPRWAALSAWPG